MARRAFDITSSSGTVRLDQQRTGKVVFTVTNGTGKSITARANIAAKPGTDPAWLAIQGDDERDVMPNGTLQYTVEVSVPVQAGGDQFGFYLEVVNIDNPDEDFVTGPLVSFAAAEQPKPEPPAPAPPPPRRKMPWWIYVAVGIWTIIIAACLSQDELLVWICAVPLIGAPLLLVARRRWQTLAMNELRESETRSETPWWVYPVVAVAGFVIAALVNIVVSGDQGHVSGLVLGTILWVIPIVLLTAIDAEAASPETNAGETSEAISPAPWKVCAIISIWSMVVSVIVNACWAYRFNDQLDRVNREVAGFWWFVCIAILFAVPTYFFARRRKFLRPGRPDADASTSAVAPDANSVVQRPKSATSISHSKSVRWWSVIVAFWTAVALAILLLLLTNSRLLWLLSIFIAFVVPLVAFTRRNWQYATEHKNDFTWWKYPVVFVSILPASLFLMFVLLVVAHTGFAPRIRTSNLHGGALAVILSIMIMIFMTPTFVMLICHHLMPKPLSRWTSADALAIGLLLAFAAALPLVLWA